MSPVDVTVGYESLEEIVDPISFTETAQQGLQKAKEIAFETINKTRDKEAPQFDAQLPPHLVLKQGLMTMRVS